MSTEKMKKYDRKHKSMRINTVLLPAVKPALKGRGIDEVRLVNDWEKIVGYHLASKTMVDKITYNNKNGILHITTLGAFASEVSYQSEYIMQKVNAYLGGIGIYEIKIYQNLPFEYVQQYTSKVYDSPKPKPAPPPRTDIEVIENIEDERLKNTLRRLAGYIYKDS